ncbi:YitT family protein [Tissierellaceae bacterium HCP3S3_D8]
MTDIKDDKNEMLRKLFFVVIGNLLCAIAFNAFFIPSKLLSGGVGGLALMNQYLTGLPTGITVFIINIPIFLIGARMVDKEFAIYGFISMFIFSSLLTITNGIDKYIILDDILLGAVIGGVLNGIGMGLMFKNRTSQGGFDIIAAILKKKYNMNIGTGLMIMNTVIISLSSFLFGVRSAMYTLISMYIGYQVLDKVQTGFNVKKNVVIVSNKSEELADRIIGELNRSITFLEGSGGYKKENKHVIYCIVTSKEIVKLKEIIDRIDPSAFLIINDVIEVRGSTFKSVGI